MTLDGFFEGAKSWDIGWHELDLAASLTRKGLIDEYRLGLNPVVLGAGSPLFKPAPDGTSMKMKLLEARALKTGCVLLRYQPAPYTAV